ncbi:general substrate transporter, partial [Lactarius hatsudake]
YDTGQISDILRMDDFLLHFAQCGVPGDVATCHFSRVCKGPIVSLLSIRTLFGALVPRMTANFLGCRCAMQSECLVFCTGVIVQITSKSEWAQFSVGRLITSLRVDAFSAAIPMYQAETAPPQIRGALILWYR